MGVRILLAECLYFLCNVSLEFYLHEIQMENCGQVLLSFDIEKNLLITLIKILFVPLRTFITLI